MTCIGLPRVIVFLPQPPALRDICILVTTEASPVLVGSSTSHLIPPQEKRVCTLSLPLSHEQWDVSLCQEKGGKGEVAQA